MPQAVTQAQQHMPELDGIRGIAILGVLCSHAVTATGVIDWPPVSFAQVLVRSVLTPLWGGVDLFFVLSGFLITGILLRTRRNSNYFFSFYGRRVLRIFPIYYLVLVVTSLLGHFSHTAHSFLPPTHSWKLSYFFYLQNWPVFWHGEKTMGSVWGAYWSLAVEEQFYFVWPFVVFLLSETAITAVCCVGLVCALPLRIFLSVHYSGDSFGLAQITTSRVDGLLIGAACAVYIYRYRKPVPMPWIVTAATAGLAIMAYIVLFHSYELMSTGKWITTVGITGYALLSGVLVAASQHHPPMLQRALTLGWLRAAGKYSYGIYVYHLLVIFPVRNYLLIRHGVTIHPHWATGFLLVLAEMTIVFVVAKLSYDHFESRILRLKSYFNPASTLASRLQPR